MEDQQNASLLDRTNSAETFIPAPQRNANAKALKVAGLTLLACLLLAGQALTIYFVMGQRDHITALEQGQENLKNQMLTRRPAVAPKKMQMAMNSMPLLTSLSDDDSPPQKSPLTKVQSTAFLREGSGVVEGPRLAPRKMLRPIGPLPVLGEFEEKDLVSTEAPAEVETKCKLEANKVTRPGVYKPQCDEQGNYLPKQCWHSTGYCWCVDKEGKAIKGTETRGPLHCGDVN
ncbi:CD74 molecule, major histocompatibility complex, class II invariant chain a [Hoplias malabaricus]|uniref:CD74 molecule, major histocompatibility complex, class II invariant chain a n=1 Tax=Hoplias malabaricus TaxID=27720 RepID=UPI003462AA58